MAKAKVDKKIISIINEFITEIRKHYDVDAVYLFGSYAKGTTHKWSDIDLAIVSADIKDRIDERINMLIIASKFDADIEPHPFSTEDFNPDDSVMADEILRTGIRVA